MFTGIIVNYVYIVRPFKASDYNDVRVYLVGTKAEVMEAGKKLVKAKGSAGVFVKSMTEES